VLTEFTPCILGRFFKKLRFLVQIFCGVVCESLQEEAGVILKLPDQKTQGLLVLIAFKRLFPVHSRKVFDEIPVRI
jgi:hypothetical protein